MTSASRTVRQYAAGRGWLLPGRAKGQGPLVHQAPEPMGKFPARAQCLRMPTKSPACVLQALAEVVFRSMIELGQNRGGDVEPI
jgi:hypothetical protein